MISIKTRGNFNKTEKLLKKSLGKDWRNVLSKYGEAGCSMLSSNSPIDSGLMSSSWRYSIEESRNRVSVIWHNDDIENGYNVAILIQYGHATKNGGWVEGIDFINPSLRPIFDSLAEAAWKEVVD